MAAPVYFNEQSLPACVTDGNECSVLHDLVMVLKCLKQHGVEAVCADTNFVQTCIIPGKTLFEVLKHCENKINRDDVTLLTMMLTTVTYPYKQLLDDACVLSADYNNNQVLGLAVSSQMLCDGVCLSMPQTSWNSSEYQIHLKLIDDNLAEVDCTSRTQNVCSVNSVKQCALLSLPQVECPTSGRVLCEKLTTYFPHLEFSKLAKEQLKAMKSSERVRQVYHKLADIECGAKKMLSGVIRPDLFVCKANPESDTRENKLQDALSIIFEDGKTHFCSWHEYFTPGAGRIYFCSDEDRDNIILVGYIGEKIAKS